MQNDAEHQQLCYALQQVANESCGKFLRINKFYNFNGIYKRKSV